ncbi:HTH domain-containing protein [Solitalea koreensis]|uniref:HTH domain-containing protein n=1 Tax=Solitalea koreensis TaxID=543615 RepID=A0A521DN55_9SPHI|nr:HTH domain-containing protein [Solitalea koreensis]
MIEIIFRLEQLDYLIKTSKTGSRKVLAQKLKVSERTISRWLEFMRDRGAEIEYDRKINSFLYKKSGNFVVKAEFIENISLWILIYFYLSDNMF